MNASIENVHRLYSIFFDLRGSFWISVSEVLKSDCIYMDYEFERCA